MIKAKRIGQNPYEIVARDRPAVAQWLGNAGPKPPMEQYIGAVAELEVASLLNAVCVAEGINQYDVRVPKGRFRGRVEVKATMSAKFSYQLRSKAAKWVARVRLERIGNDLWITDARIGPKFSRFYPCRTQLPWRTIPGFSLRKLP
ncbi:hypothetical protein [Sphingomonas sp. PAMC 26605]|uniref:hypothetical protein n=1 Tax=Sphingomonas sp. PAMC 26605 TaxID=1112214 RepID=UPI00026CDE4C|nr:hypothetical protein [Sphingomonas sp. PAMC 26605]